RYGGEEFILSLKGYSATEGESFANQLRTIILEQPLHTAEGNISVSFSSGVSEASFEAGETLHQLLNKADKALYAAKRAGRNQVQIYSNRASQRM
ncbi:GGDEF domain-containing protein, partial [Bacillus sp. JJ1764]|uniref:GGDEF domain-containing protein n=1 Tax=Bacillus sp. JJ1764 TaxID=3122964 RepID=UPI002FFE57F3